MLLLEFYYCIALFSVAVAVSTHLCVVCRHFCCPVSLFQAHVTCRNFTLTWPVQHIESTLFKMDYKLNANLGFPPVLQQQKMYTVPEE